MTESVESISIRTLSPLWIINPTSQRLQDRWHHGGSRSLRDHGHHGLHVCGITDTMESLCGVTDAMDTIFVGSLTL
jgi:hypothetical protein